MVMDLGRRHWLWRETFSDAWASVKTDASCFWGAAQKR